MQKFYKHLYWDEEIPQKERNGIKWRLKVSKPSKPCYILTVCNGPDQLEIYNSMVLLQSFYRENPRVIVGIAGSKKAAVEMVQQIAEACYAKNGNADLKKYLIEQSELV